MEGKQIKNCGKYNMVECVVGNDLVPNGGVCFKKDDILAIGKCNDGVYIDFAGVKTYESSARFVEYFEEMQLAETHIGPIEINEPVEVQLAEPHAYDDIKAMEKLQAEQLTVSDGSTASYYELPANATELQDLISFKNMNAQMGEIQRAVYRYGEVAHSEKLRDAKKIKFYIEAEIKRLETYES